MFECKKILYKILNLLSLFIIISDEFENWKNTEDGFWKEKKKKLNTFTLNIKSTNMALCTSKHLL